MREYIVITQVKNECLKEFDDKKDLDLAYSKNKRVSFNKNKVVYCYSYKPLTLYKSGLNYCVKNVSKIVNNILKNTKDQ
jgi:hypothetical protein